MQYCQMLKGKERTTKQAGETKQMCHKQHRTIIKRDKTRQAQRLK
ncbi:hypothetical protein RSAG8_04501, partial [Rhizoctonia solani AG-8 WAC10335]